MTGTPTLLSATRSLLTVLIVANVFCAIAFVGVLVLTVTHEALWLTLAGSGVRDSATIVFWIRTVLVISLLVVPLAHLLLTRLRHMVRSVETGSPFSTANAARLQVIAWCLLAIQLVDLGYGLADARTAEAGEVFGWSPGLTGWLAVLLLFVLARVFARGAEMDEELAATV